MRYSAMPMMLSTLSILSGCDARLCSYGRYGDTSGCASNDLQVALALPTTRTDVRDKQPFAVHVQVRSRTGPQRYWLATPGTLKLSIDGRDLVDVPVELSEDRGRQQQSLLVRRDPDPLSPGGLRLQVTVGDLASVDLAEGAHRVFRSPRFDANRRSELIKGSNPHRGGTVQARTSVQVAMPFGGSARQLLTTELASTVVGPVRWLELFRSASAGTGLEYDDSGSWTTLQLKMQERPTALLTNGKGMIVLYDLDNGSGRNDLSIIPYFGARQSQLSTNEPQIPTQATSISACADESLLAVALSGEVRFFMLDPGMPKPVRWLATRMVAGVAAPVLAMRDLAGVIPSQRLQTYIAAVADGQGQVSLIPLIGSGTSATLDLNGVVTLARGGVDRALALADLDSDGLQDVVFVAADGQVGWLPQEPSGAFGAAQELGLSLPDAASLSIGDLNGDQVPDLAVATTTAAGGNVTVFWNQGS